GSRCGGSRTTPMTRSVRALRAALADASVIAAAPNTVTRLFIRGSLPHVIQRLPPFILTPVRQQRLGEIHRRLSSISQARNTFICRAWPKPVCIMGLNKHEG